MRRHKMLDEIRQLDPERDHQRIVYIDTFHEFPWDTTRSLELALIRTFAVPSSAALLHGTGEFMQFPQRRYDDTTLILSEILENGYDSARGRAALRRMNRQHGRYPIPNDEFLYVLSTFVFEPIRWNARFGWRPMVAKEKLATFYYWQAIGRFMNIKDIPDDYETLERYNIEYERAHFRHAPQNEALAVRTEQMFLSWYLPRPLIPLGAPALHALMDPLMLQALGRPDPGPAMRRLVAGGMRTRARVLRYFPERRQPNLFTARPNRTYPRGYRLEELGPTR
jgi:hypothetical protein